MALRLEPVEDLHAFEDEWAALAAEAAPANPFAAPGWLIPWAEEFVDARDLRVFAVRDGDELLGVAPFYLTRHAGPLWRIRELQTLGTGRAQALTELPQVLARSGDERRVLRFLLQELLFGDEQFDWLHVSLPAAQGWIEPDWLRQNGSGPVALQKGARAAVVVDSLSEQDLRANASPNLREALRKARRRLYREGHAWSVSAVEGDAGIETALERFLELHAARADMQARKPHPNHFDSPERRRFLERAARHLSRSGRFAVYTLSVGGETAAAQIVLRAPASTYLYFSGLDPSWWSYGAGVLLKLECLKDAGARGFREANLSIGPDGAKLRWGGRLSLHNDFVVVKPRRRSKAIFSAYWLARAAFVLARESRRGAIPALEG